LDDRHHQASRPRRQALLLRLLDAFSRLVVAGRGEGTQTTLLVTNTLGMSTSRRDRGDGLVIHSDRGRPFISWAFSRQVRGAGPAPSMGAVGSTYDNALAEFCWGGCWSSSSTANAGRRAIPRCCGWA